MLNKAQVDFECVLARSISAALTGYFFGFAGQRREYSIRNFDLVIIIASSSILLLLLHLPLNVGSSASDKLKRLVETVASLCIISKRLFLECSDSEFTVATVLLSIIHVWLSIAMLLIYNCCARQSCGSWHQEYLRRTK